MDHVACHQRCNAGRTDSWCNKWRRVTQTSDNVDSHQRAVQDAREDDQKCIKDVKDKDEHTPLAQYACHRIPPKNGLHAELAGREVVQGGSRQAREPFDHANKAWTAGYWCAQIAGQIMSSTYHCCWRIQPSHQLSSMNSWHNNAVLEGTTHTQ